MQTSFADIETMVEDRLAAVETKPNVPLRQKAIAGFMISDVSGQEAEIQNWKTELHDFRSRRSEVIRNLQEIGITPLAVIPSNLWRRICDRSALYRFTPIGNRVRVKVATVNNIENLSTAISWLLGLSVVFGMALFYYMHPALWEEFTIWIGIAATAVGCVLAGISWPLQTRLYARFYDRMPHEKIVRRFLPEMEAYESHISDTAEVTLILPSLPIELVPVIEKAGRIAPTNSCPARLRVAAVMDAFSFAEKPSVVFRKRLGELATQRAAERAARADPIIYLDYGKVVAIIGQFGDFPIEREAVEAVLEQEDQLL